MGDGTFDNLKGNAKEALGDLTDDRDLEREGKVDQAAGNLKDKLGNVADKVKDAVNSKR